MKSIILVVLQICIIGLFSIRGGIFRSDTTSLMIASIAAIFGLWAVWTMRRHLNVFPELRAEAKLLEKGPYGLVRHPMYFSLLLLLLPAVVWSKDWILVIAYILLIVILVLKVKIEERHLADRFSHFEDYQKRVKSIFPWIF